MTRRRNKRFNSSKEARARNSVKSGITADAQTLSVIPRLPGNSVTTIRRSSTRILTFSDLNGLDGTGYFDLELLFGGAINYNLNGVSVYTDNLPNVAEFSNLYDQYRVKDVVVRIDMPMSNGNSFPMNNPLVYWAVDRDDKGSVTLSTMQEYERTQVHSFNTNGYKPLIIKFKPTPLKDVAGYGVGTGYSPDLSEPFLRTGDMTSIPYYGLKFFFDNFNSASATVNSIRVTNFVTLNLANPR